MSAPAVNALAQLLLRTTALTPSSDAMSVKAAFISRSASELNTFRRSGLLRDRRATPSAFSSIMAVILPCKVSPLVHGRTGTLQEPCSHLGPEGPVGFASHGEADVP